MIPNAVTSQKETSRSTRAILPLKAPETPNNTNNPVRDISIEPIPPGSAVIIPMRFAIRNITTMAVKLISVLKA